MPLPSIHIGNRQVREVIKDIWTAIRIGNSPPWLFQREGKLIQLIPGDEPRLDIVGPDRMYGIALDVADYYRGGGDKEPVAAAPNKELIKAMVAGVDTTLPTIEGVSSVPMFLATGVLFAQNGYSPELRIQFYGMGGLGTRGTTAPTKDAAIDAVRYLREEVYGNFPFAGEDEFAHVLATLLLPFVRSLIKGATPIHLIEANGPGSGKTLLAEVNTAIATGTIPGLIAPAGSEEEMRKRITSFMSEGHVNIILDNVSKEINSGVLASAITGEKWQDRPLYGNRIITLPNKATWQITANNPRLSLEVARRCIRIRLLGNERPWERQEGAYRHPNLLAWVLEHRGELINHVCSIVQYWFSQACPRSSKILGSFESWSNIIGGILQVTGVEGYLANCQDLYAESDPNSQEWEEAVEYWHESEGEKWLTPTELELMFSSKRMLGLILGSGMESSRTIRLGIALAGMKDSVIGGYTISRQKNPKTKQVLYSLKGGTPTKQAMIAGVGLD